MKISVSVYSFMQYIRDGRLTPIECIAKAKEMGFDAIEFVEFVFPEGEDKMEYAKKLRAESDRVGLPISNFAFGADLLNGKDRSGDVPAEIERVKGLIDVAEVLGCPTIRHDVAFGFAEGNPRLYRGFDNVLAQLADGCRKITEYAKTKGIKTMTENHGQFSQESTRVEKLVNTVANENFGLLVDMGNFVCADDDPGVAVGRCAPYAFYAHAKDFIIKPGTAPNPGEGFFSSRGGKYLRGTIIGHGDVPVLQCLRALKAGGYDGYLAIEFEGMEDCIQGISIGLANLKRYVAEVYGE
ncbi:MAG: sugar phosphate isomerase/epimerase [Oscillospiraceae bacterium]|jgi:sugar phosphate isomerase/epimerase|nr:sugar phosphate isomerase/epimerase [Oscillospiraceae bacterium]